MEKNLPLVKPETIESQNKEATDCHLKCKYANNMQMSP